MKKLSILIFSFLVSIISVKAEEINECKSDIYFGNGVWNTQFSSDNCIEDPAADCSQRDLNELIKREIINDDPNLQVKFGEVKLAYNWGQGHMLDVLETYYQLREAGQLEGIGFFTIMSILSATSPRITLGAIATQRLLEPLTRDWEQGNISEMWTNYYNESFKLGHRVLLVSHSQGNMFANRIHDTIVPMEYRDYFANLQVASPASEVKAVKGDYVTLVGDFIINPIPGSMIGNANGLPGHAFVSAYLGQLDPYTKIVTKMKQLLPTLDVEASQWHTDREYDIDTMDYRITVKHRFDTSVIMNEEVYPFAPSKKLYQSKDENGVFQYVKASCGGTEIKASWEGQAEGEFYLLEGTGEKISSLHNFMEDFEESAFGWTNNQRDSSAGLTKFLGRFGGSNGIQEISKTYSFGETYKNRGITIKFDMYQIDSWDGDSYFNQTYENGIEKFLVYFNDMLVSQDIYHYGYAYSNSSQTVNNEFSGWGPEIIHHYEMHTITDDNGDVKLGFGTTLNQPVVDESYGIDNIEIRLSDDT